MRHDEITKNPVRAQTAPGRRTRGSTPMGRGRAKAKQTKVARELKYFSPDTDLTALQRELGSRGDREPVERRSSDTDDDDYGEWASGER
ncbi:MAG: DUF3073 domain-containing protein [Angustibacter sp.]